MKLITLGLSFRLAIFLGSIPQGWSLVIPPHVSPANVTGLATSVNTQPISHAIPPLVGVDDGVFSGQPILDNKNALGAALTGHLRLDSAGGSPRDPILAGVLSGVEDIDNADKSVERRESKNARAAPPPPPPPPPPPARPNTVTGPPRTQPQKPRPDSPPRLQPDPNPKFKNIPDNVYPGQGVPNPAEIVKPISEYADLGKKMVTLYEKKAMSQDPDTAITRDKASIGNFQPPRAFMDYRSVPGYAKPEDTSVQAGSGKLENLNLFKLKELGLTSPFGKDVVQVGVAAEKSRAGGYISLASYHKGGEYIVYQQNYKADNDLITGSVPLNEIGMQNFLRVAGQNAKNFKVIFVIDIVNKATWDITRAAYNKAKQNFDQVMTFRRDTEEFNLFMGCPNLSSKFYSLMNHHNAIGKKLVDKIIVIPKQASKNQDSLNIALVFKNA